MKEWVEDGVEEWVEKWVKEWVEEWVEDGVEEWVLDGGVSSGGEGGRGWMVVYMNGGGGGQGGSGLMVVYANGGGRDHVLEREGHRERQTERESERQRAKYGFRGGNHKRRIDSKYSFASPRNLSSRGEISQIRGKRS